MKVIVATANTMENWENYPYTLGVFSSKTSFKDWLYSNFVVDRVDKKSDIYFIFYKGSIKVESEDGTYSYFYEVEDDGEVCYELETGQYVKLEEIEVI